MDANPSSRPSASDIYNTLNIWHMILTNNYVKMFKNGLIMKELFESADLIIPTLSTAVPSFSQAKLTSKLLNFQNISNPINSAYDSAFVSFPIRLIIVVMIMNNVM